MLLAILDTRIYCTADNESHFDTVTVDLAKVDASTSKFAVTHSKADIAADQCYLPYTSRRSVTGRHGTRG